MENFISMGNPTANRYFQVYLVKVNDFQQVDQFGASSTWSN